MEFDPQTGHVIPPYEGWRPFCLVCSSTARMVPLEYGWKCGSCGNEIGHDLEHHKPQPK